MAEGVAPTSALLMAVNSTVELKVGEGGVGHQELKVGEGGVGQFKVILSYTSYTMSSNREQENIMAKEGGGVTQARAALC